MSVVGPVRPRVVGGGRRVEQGLGVLIASDGAKSVCKILSEESGVGVVGPQGS